MRSVDDVCDRDLEVFEKERDHARIYDVFQQLFGIGANHASRTSTRMPDSFPELREAGNPLWITCAAADAAAVSRPGISSSYTA